MIFIIDRTENTELNEREVKRDQSLLEIQDLQTKLTNLQEEKTTMENELNETIDILKQNYEKFQNDHGKLVSVYFLDLQSLS